MPRKRKPPRLYLRERDGRQAQWVILDGTREVGTGCFAADIGGAEKALREYLAAKYIPPATSKGGDLLVTEVLTYYAQHKMPYTERPDAIENSVLPLVTFWAGKSIAQINGQSCRKYVGWRQEWIRPSASKLDDEGKPKKLRKAGIASAWHDLKNLRAALNFYHAEHTLDALPVVTLPEKSAPRERWLTRAEIARLLWAARGDSKRRHVARFILIGYYTGTRSTAIQKLRWMPSTEGGWFDVEEERLYRKPLSQPTKNHTKGNSKKRQPPAKIHARLLPFLHRWRERDLEQGITHVVHYAGKPVKKLRRSWDTVRKNAGLAEEKEDGVQSDVVRHTLRHSAATWLMQAGVSIWDAAGYLGMSPETLERVYGHHHPDFQSDAAQAIPPKKRPRNRPFKVIEGGTNGRKKA